jgi:hypothetical protein
VHGAAQVVAEFKDFVVHPNGGIDVKILAILALEIKNSVMRKNPQPSELYFEGFGHELTLLAEA